ncbi:MAG: 50S ribosomal protein L11, partial [Clostridia bacterium]|nr:50S ribosomal protein L11 [Clostridia bacterium]
PPAAVLIKKTLNLEKGSGVPNKTKVATMTFDQCKEIAQIKMKDLNAYDLDQAAKMIAGTARSMGVVVEG